MSRVQEFYDWLEDQDYWVDKSEVEEKFPDIEFRESTGVTMKQGEDGECLIPRRDLRSLAREVCRDDSWELSSRPLGFWWNQFLSTSPTLITGRYVQPGYGQ